MLFWDIFHSVEAINAVFKLGFVPAKEEFYELTPEQYELYYSTNERTGEKIFMLLPDDPQIYNEVASGDVFVVTEQEMSRFEGAGLTIERYCARSKKTFATFEDKLRYVAGKLPPFFTVGTKYARASEQKLPRRKK